MCKRCPGFAVGGKGIVSYSLYAAGQILGAGYGGGAFNSAACLQTKLAEFTELT